LALEQTLNVFKSSNFTISVLIKVMSTESKNAAGSGIIDHKTGKSRKVKCYVKEAGLEGINRGDQNDKIIQVLYAYMYGKLKLNQNPLEAELFLLRI
jgi:hypothetical protein